MQGSELEKNQGAVEKSTSKLNFTNQAKSKSSEKKTDLNRKYNEQQAIEDFYENKPLKEEVYKKAEDEGKQTFMRNIIVQQNTQTEDTKTGQEKSIYISELLK